MSAEDVSTALKTASEIVDMAGTAPGPIGIAAKLASLALKAGSAIALAGRDPVIEIARILSSDPLVRKVHDEFETFISNELPPAPDTQPASHMIHDDDEYEDD